MPPPTRLLSRRFVLVTASTFLYFTAMSTLVPTLPRYVRDELGGGGIEIGIAVGVFAIAAGILRPFAGRLGDERGRRLLVIGGSGLFGVAVLGYLAATSLALLVVARLVGGAGEAAMWVGSATSTQDLAPPDRRAEAASYYSVALYAGSAVGPVLGESLMKGPGFDAVWLLAAGLAFGACLLGSQIPATAKPAATERGPLLHRAAIAPGLVLLFGLVPFSVFSAFLPVYAERVGMDDIGPPFALFAVLVVCIRIFGARIPDRVGARKLSSVALCAIALAPAIVALWASPAAVWLAVTSFAIGQALMFPGLFALVVAGVSDAERGRAIGTFSVFFDMAHGLGVPLLGVLVATAGVRWAYASTIVMAVVGFLVLRRTVAAGSGRSPRDGAPVPL